MIYQGRYYTSDYQLERELAEIEKQYNPETIIRHIESAQNDIQSLQEGIKRCQEYISRLIYHKNLVDTVSYKYRAYCHREAWRTPITYHTGVYKIPCVPHGEERRTTIDAQKFSGKERGAAIQRAKNLAKQYKCELELRVNAKR